MMKKIRMNKKRILLLGLLLVAFVALLMPKSKTVYGISPGTYEMADGEADGCVPVIYFDMTTSEIRFTLSADRRISLAHHGIVKLDGKAYAISENGDDQWIFEVVDNETIKFVQKGSSRLRLSENRILPDGAVFRYVKE